MCSKNKGADQLRGYHAADLPLCLTICKKSRFSHNTAQFTKLIQCYNIINTENADCNIYRLKINKYV